MGCEFPGRVRDAFRALGHDAWSCDLLPTEADPRWHYREDVRDCLRRGWDLAILHPECRYLALSGVRWLYVGGRKENGPDAVRWAKMQAAAEFFRDLLDADVERLAVENSEMHPYALEIVGRPADQVIQPWMFGEPQTKAAHLWLKGLDPLEPTDIVPEHLRRADCHREPPGPLRWMNRSRTTQKVADAFAAQWGQGVPSPAGG